MQHNIYIYIYNHLIYLYIAGYCTEYNERGNLIQSSIGTSCKTFNVKPCPIFYRSNEAYKCEYHLTNDKMEHFKSY